MQRIAKYLIKPMVSSLFWGMGNQKMQEIAKDLVKHVVSSLFWEMGTPEDAKVANTLLLGNWYPSKYKKSRKTL